MNRCANCDEFEVCRDMANRCMLASLGPSCPKHREAFGTREMDGGYIVEYCLSCEREQSERLAHLFGPKS